MSKILLVRQGESLPFAFDLGGEILTGWTCDISVADFPGNIPQIDRRVTPDEVFNSWLGNLTRTETLGLPIGLYQFIGRIENINFAQSDDVMFRFRIGLPAIV